MSSAIAQLCDQCGQGSKSTACIKCGREVFNDGVEAKLCGVCGSGFSKDNCIKCGRTTFGNGKAAQLCMSCRFSSGSKCAKCDAHVF